METLTAAFATVPAVIGLGVLGSLPLWKPKYDFANFEGHWRLYEERGISFMTFKRLPMFDWDMPSPGHKALECITVQNRQEVLDIVQQVCSDHGVTITLEATPGGVRGWLHEPVSFKKWSELSQLLKSDDLYRKLVLRRGIWSTRVSAKQRPGDFVARYWTTVGSAPMCGITLDSYNAYREVVSRVEPRHVMTCGLPGSGKSTYAKQLAESGAYYYIGTDKCREELWGDESIQGPWPEVWAQVLRHVDKAKAAGLPVVYDGCNLTPKMRSSILNVVGGEWEVAWRDVPPEVCLEQQKGRKRQVPKEVIYRMASYFDPPTTEEEGIVAVYKI